MGIPKSIVDNAQADDNTRITALEADVTALGTDKANVSGQVFSGSISAPNLTGTNTGNQLAAAVPAVTSTDLTYVDATGTVIVAVGVFPTVAEVNVRFNEIKDDFNALRAELAALKANLVAASPSPLLAT